MNSSTLSCRCGKVAFQVRGRHIASVECLCNSCRESSGRLQKLPNAPEILTANGGTRYVMLRKDCVQFDRGTELLREFRLSPEAKTRRVVASCCNTPIFVEFLGGHWLSTFDSVWPRQSLPPLELRTMTGDSPGAKQLPNDVPNAKTHTLKFYWKLFAAWAAMGFRAPKIKFVKGSLDVG
jgi:hypothetical protein